MFGHKWHRLCSDIMSRPDIRPDDTFAGGLRRMSETRYAQVARDLTESIASGRFPVGSLLPTELELCAHYGTSRQTVRAAIRELQELGLVSRRKKAGTRVETASVSSGYRQSLASVEDLVQFGATHVREVQEVEDVVIDRALAKELGCAPGTRWLRISSLRLNGKPNAAPIGWTDVSAVRLKRIRCFIVISAAAQGSLSVRRRECICQRLDVV